MSGTEEGSLLVSISHEGGIEVPELGQFTTAIAPTESMQSRCSVKLTSVKRDGEEPLEREIFEKIIKSAFAKPEPRFQDDCVHLVCLAILPFTEGSLRAVERDVLSRLIKAVYQHQLMKSLDEALKAGRVSGARVLEEVRDEVRHRSQGWDANKVNLYILPDHSGQRRQDIVVEMISATSASPLKFLFPSKMAPRSPAQAARQFILGFTREEEYVPDKGISMLGAVGTAG